MMARIRVFEAFAGYGAQALALERLKRNNPNFDFEVVGISEVDKYAIAAYNAIHGDTQNFGDIAKIDWSQVPDFDLFTYSSPCTNFSSLGNKKGGEKGSNTASSLLWECEKAIELKKPKYLLMENVSDIKKKQFSKTLHKWMRTLEEKGYSNNAFIANSKDYGLPQDRKRMFMVSFLDETRTFYEPNQTYEETSLSQIVDKEPNLYKKTPKKIIGQIRGRRFEETVIMPRPHGYLKPVPRTICPALTTTCGGDYFLFFPDGETRGITPKEAFKLMGLSENEAESIISSGIPPTALFKLAGNSIAVNVMKAVFESMFFTEKPVLNQQIKLF